MDGLQLTQRMKADAATRGVRIVVLTASAIPEEIKEALAAGCDGDAIKSIDTRTLPDLIRRRLKPGETM